MTGTFLVSARAGGRHTQGKAAGRMRPGFGPEPAAEPTQVGWTASRCPHDVSLVAEVDADAVMADVRQLLPADRRRGQPGPVR